MKKMFALILALVLCLSCCAALAEDDKPYIGIIQKSPHVALDQARDGFIQALADHGYVDGETIKLNVQNAQGDASNLASIADQFVGDNADLVLAITTDAATTMASKTETIPILGTAITSYVGEKVRLAESNEKPGYNISGTSDMNPVEAQIALIPELFPEAKTIGMLYSFEENSAIQIELAKAATEALGLEWVEVVITNTNEVQQATQQIVEICDAIYIPTDNVFASSMPVVYGVVAESKTPVVAGEEGMVMAGGLASLALSYYDLGYKTGLMAIDVLQGANISEMPIQFITSDFVYVFNKTMADEIGFEIPEKYQEYAKEMATAE